MLERRGHSVIVAENGKQAIAALAKHKFDVVLMDVQMPEMGGIEATQEIRGKEKSAGGHIPIFAMTAHAMQGTANGASRRGWMGTFPSRLIRNHSFERSKRARRQSRSLQPVKAARNQMARLMERFCSSDLAAPEASAISDQDLSAPIVRR